MALLPFALLGCFAFLLYRIRCSRLPRGVSLPPGPRGLPFLGLIRNVPHEYAWLAYTEWAKHYGDIVYLKTYGQPLVILNSYKVAHALLEERSAIYSGRPRMVMADELMGWDWDFLHMTHCDRWRQHRRVFHQSFQSRVIPAYYPTITRAAHRFAVRLSASPEEFVNHIRHFVGGIVLRITYGYDVASDNDEYVRLAQVANSPLQVAHAKSYLVEYIPALKYIPSWFPGAKFKRQAKEWAKHTMRLRDSPFQSVKTSMLAGPVTPCIVSEFLDQTQTKGSNTSEEVVKNCAALAYAAGSDTTVSLLESWMLAVAMFPDVQKRAQSEMDSVMGKNHLPDFSSRPSLPYLEATILEVLRWNPTAPSGIPHVATEDDIYEGFYIPKGATVVGNFWAISRDPELYPDPEKFIPERFFPQEGKRPQLDPIEAGAFGFGRRICPGRYLAMSSAWLALAHILVLYEILPAVDENGRKIELKRESTTGVSVHPKPFKIQFLPRSKDAVNLIQAMKDEESVTV